MKFVVNLISDIVDQYYLVEQPAAECNYADNYYGDQVCVIKGDD